MHSKYSAICIVHTKNIPLLPCSSSYKSFIKTSNDLIINWQNSKHRCTSLAWLACTLCVYHHRSSIQHLGRAVGRYENPGGRASSNVVGIMEFIFCLGQVWSMDDQKPIPHFPTLVYTVAVSTFVEKMMSYVMLLNERLWHVFYKKGPKTFYGAKLIFWSFATFLV